MARGTAGSDVTQRRPKHWDKMVSAAYLRMMGSVQKAAAKAVGRSERTIQAWEADGDTWREARAEARERWLADGDDAARRAVLGSIQAGNAAMGQWWLERRDEGFAPPKQKHEVGGKGGDPIEITVTRRIVRPED